MIHRPALAAHSPPAESLNQISTGNHDTHHSIQSLSSADEFPGKGVSLGDRARKPIKEKAGGAIGVLQPLRYHSRYEFIRDQFSFVHVGTGLLPEGRFLSHCLPQKVSGRDMRNAERRLEHLRLRPFPSARRPYQYDAHVFLPRS
jgi:hypothetical protein